MLVTAVTVTPTQWPLQSLENEADLCTLTGSFTRTLLSVKTPGVTGGETYAVHAQTAFGDRQLLGKQSQLRTTTRPPGKTSSQKAEISLYVPLCF